MPLGIVHPRVESSSLGIGYVSGGQNQNFSISEQQVISEPLFKDSGVSSEFSLGPQPPYVVSGQKYVANPSAQLPQFPKPSIPPDLLDITTTLAFPHALSSTLHALQGKSIQPSILYALLSTYLTVPPQIPAAFHETNFVAKCLRVPGVAANTEAGSGLVVSLQWDPRRSPPILAAAAAAAQVAAATSSPTIMSAVGVVGGLGDPTQAPGEGGGVHVKASGRIPLPSFPLAAAAHPTTVPYHHPSIMGSGSSSSSTMVTAPPPTTPLVDNLLGLGLLSLSDPPALLTAAGGTPPQGVVSPVSLLHLAESSSSSPHPTSLPSLVGVPDNVVTGAAANIKVDVGGGSGASNSNNNNNNNNIINNNSSSSSNIHNKGSNGAKVPLPKKVAALLGRGGDWNCPACEHMNFTGRTACQSCGAPQPPPGSQKLLQSKVRRLCVSHDGAASIADLTRWFRCVWPPACCGVCVCVCVFLLQQ